MSDGDVKVILERIDALAEEVRAMRAVAGDRLLTKAQAAEELRVSIATFDRMRARGSLPKPVGDARSLRWRLSELRKVRRG
jgi:predicted DNA-binding transcriptional regulator AlpA